MTQPTPPTLWQRIRGGNGARLAFLITTIATFAIAFFAIANSRMDFEPVICIGVAILCLACGILAAAIAVCIGNAEARHRTWNEPRRFFLFVMLVFFIIGSSIAGFAGTQHHPVPALIISGLIATGFFLLSFLGLILSVIPWTRPLMNWVVRHRFFVLAGIISLVALFYAEENWRGKRAWENYKRAQEAKGEYLDFKHLIPPPVPDDQNFAQCPLLKATLDYRRENNRVVWGDTNTTARLQELSSALPLRSDKKINPPGQGDLFKGTSADMTQWLAYFQGNTNFPQAAAEASPAEVMLVALSKFDAGLGELEQAAATRPLARFAIKYDEEPAWGILLPHLAHIKGLTKLVSTRTLARLEAKQYDSALADLKLGLRISDSIKDEPILISHLVRIACLNIILKGVQDGLACHAWNDAQLAEIQDQLGQINLFTELRQALRGERALGVAGLDWLRRKGMIADQDFLFSGSDGGTQRAMAGSMNIFPTSFYYFNMLNVARMEEAGFLGFDPESRRVFPEKTGLVEKELSELPPGFHPFSIFARMLVPALGKSGMKAARMQIYIDLALVACALERHRLAQGEYPGSLTVLAPQYIAQLPHDVMTGDPLHYRRTTDGYVLYSAGWNQKDDGGTLAFTKRKNDPRDESPGIVDFEKGDCVWQVPAQTGHN